MLKFNIILNYLRQVKTPISKIHYFQEELHFRAFTRNLQNNDHMTILFYQFNIYLQKGYKEMYILFNEI